MKKSGLFIWGITIIAGVFIISGVGAMNKGNIEALNAYKKFETVNQNKTLSEATDFVLSDFSIDGSDLPDTEEILSFQGSRLTELLIPSDEKLWFIMDGKQVKGIVLATDTESRGAGREKTGPELYEMYQKIVNDLGEDVRLKYFDYAGGYIFVAVNSDGDESVWLEQRAARLLDATPGTKYNPEEIIEKIREGINPLEEDSSDDDTIG
ncbi:hypothetical protein NDK47_20520 [Brevibacillus ruminantium]|uniref:Uncharacterized protein n=1 Tax=Brevibacillus ruminantium TaxID=2950604 RepID=A0ABY4WFD2_9BACL|nr:hypothetical protein [Brevibacillus ruminantium]USG64510.1 hypothetical protein NDK47_20520 [Brevibacillus ruminantium]